MPILTQTQTVLIPLRRGRDPGFDLIEFDVHVFNMTLSKGLNVFRLYSAVK